MHLITGHGGTEHIDSIDFGSFNKGVVGPETYYLYGTNSTPGMTINGLTVKMKAFDVVMCGRHIRFDGTESKTLTATSQGKYRWDAVYVQYSKDASTLVESVSLGVLSGSPAASEAEAVKPTVTAGTRPDNGGSNYKGVVVYVLLYGGTISNIVMPIGKVYHLAMLTEKIIEAEAIFTKLRYIVCDSSNSYKFHSVFQVETESNVKANGNVTAGGTVQGTMVKSTGTITAASKITSSGGDIDAAAGDVNGNRMFTHNTANGVTTYSRWRSYASKVTNGNVDVSFAEMAVLGKDKSLKAAFRVYDSGKTGVYVDGKFIADRFSCGGTVTFGKKLATKVIGTVAISSDIAKDGKAHTLDVNAEVGDVQSKTISFGYTFNDVPEVFVTPRASMPDQISCSVSNVTKTGCTIYFSRSGSTSETTVHWLAVGRLYD